MKTCWDSIACAVIRLPSTTRWGTRSMISRSLNVPGSDSSALTVRYFGLGESRGTKLAFLPVAKNAPPRPRRFEASSSATIACGSSSRDRLAVRRREVERLADLAEGLRREPAAVPLLRDPERRQDRRPRLRVLRRHCPDLLQHGARVHPRSPERSEGTSPTRGKCVAFFAAFTDPPLP